MAWRVMAGVSAPDRSHVVNIFRNVAFYPLSLPGAADRAADLDWLQSYSPTWSPSGLLARVAEIIFTRHGSATEIAKALHSAGADR